MDFIHVLFFPYIFNFADCCITVGAVLLVFHFLFFAEQKSPPPLRHAQGKTPEEKP